MQDALARPEFGLFNGVESTMPGSQSRKIVAAWAEMHGDLLIPMWLCYLFSMPVHSRPLAFASMGVR
jgi:hypothetical protein